jgi:hypothetical protein
MAVNYLFFLRNRDAAANPMSPMLSAVFAGR